MTLFNKAMSVELAQLVEEHKAQLYPAKGTSQARTVANQAWQSITDQLNSRNPGGMLLSVEQVKTKVKELKRQATKELADEKKHVRRTGGGPPYKEDTDQASKAIKDSMMSTFGQSASMKGVPGGVGTDLFGEKGVVTPRSVTATPKIGQSSSSAIIVEEDPEITAITMKSERKPIRKKSPVDLQCEVLEAELENAHKISRILDRTPPLLDRIEGLIDRASPLLEAALGQMSLGQQQQQTHGYRMLHAEHGYQHQQALAYRTFLFPTRRWLLTPYLNPQNQQHFRFNQALSKGRVKVENCFGLWKRRFSINHSGYRLKLDNIPTTILATAILHNIAINMNIPVPELAEPAPIPQAVEELEQVPEEVEELDVEEERNMMSERQLRQIGQRFRDDLARRF